MKKGKQPSLEGLRAAYSDALNNTREVRLAEAHIISRMIAQRQDVLVDGLSPEPAPWLGPSTRKRLRALPYEQDEQDEQDEIVLPAEQDQSFQQAMLAYATAPPPRLEMVENLVGVRIIPPRAKRLGAIKRPGLLGEA